jgi:hypothetical protein
MWEDRVLNVVDSDGSANMTVSVHAAFAAGYRPDDVRLPLPQRRLRWMPHALVSRTKNRIAGK